MRQPEHSGRMKAALINAGALLVAIACGGGGEQTPAADSTAMTPAPEAAAPAGSFDAATITPEMLALGDSIFHGQAAGGLCLTCHGPDAKGMAGLAPDLTDTTWLNTDGSWQGIATIVMNGVPQPKQNPAPMLPMGGAQFTPDQIRAVSSYVYRLSHPM